jgi:hypothetical protein
LERRFVARQWSLNVVSDDPVKKVFVLVGEAIYLVKNGLE